MVSGLTAPAAIAQLRAVNLQCELAVDPLGVDDVQPRLFGSWPARGARSGSRPGRFWSQLRPKRLLPIAVTRGTAAR
jgi:hypothetical protein